MSFDLRLYRRTGEYDSKFQNSEWVTTSTGSMGPLLGSQTARGVEILANKVVKFLKTTYGSDVLAPTYGSRAFNTSLISQAYLPKFRLELEKDISRCVEFIKVTEDNPYFTGDKLSEINIREVIYDPNAKPSRLDIFLGITTESGVKALLAINFDLG